MTKNKLFVIMPALFEKSNLAAISGVIKLRAINSDETDRTVEIRSDSCLWDTVAQHCITLKNWSRILTLRFSSPKHMMHIEIDEE